MPFPDTPGRGTRNTISRQYSPLRHLPWYRARAGLGFIVSSKPWGLPYTSTVQFVCVCAEDTGIQASNWCCWGCWVSRLISQSRPGMPGF